MRNANIFIPVAFNTMAKPVGASCNLNCTYCYYLEKKILYPGGPRMELSLLEKYIRQYIQRQNVPVINFVWQGGEPALAGIDFYQQAISLQKQYAGGKQIFNSFQTNGLLINEQWCKFFSENNFLIGISLDGPKKFHDHNRKMKGDQPTFDQVLHAIDLLKKYKVEFNTLTTINSFNSSYPVEIYKFLKDIGSQYIQFLPVVERIAQSATEDGLMLVNADFQENAKVTPWSVTAQDYGNFMCSIFDLWVKNDVGKYYIQLFDATLANWMGENPGICVFTKMCGDALVLEANGDVYSCDHFVYPQYLLGNINFTDLFFLAKSSRQIKFGEQKWTTLPEQCKQCEYCFACYGECPKHRFEKTENGQSGLSYLCGGYKKFFAHVDPYMQYMAEQLKQKRPPANIMNVLKTGEFLKQNKS